MAEQETAAASLRVWPFAQQYEEVLKEGHAKQAPACGSPTIIRHLAIWPKKPFGDQPVNHYKEACDVYDVESAKFFEEISAFAIGLQKRGRIQNAVGLTLENAPLYGDWKQNTHAFKICRPQAIAFTLWWQDAAKAGVPNRRPSQDGPTKTDMRVRVLVQTHRDHATISFFMDVDKLFGEAQVDDGARFRKTDEFGVRRRLIHEAVDVVRNVSGEQIRKGFVEMSRMPEQGVSLEEAKALLNAADYFYDGLWNEFAGAFGFAEISAAEAAAFGTMGERFGDFRGVVMSVRGLDPTWKMGEEGEPTDCDFEKKRRLLQDELRRVNAPERDETVRAYTDREPGQDVPSYVSGTIGFGPLPKFDADINEHNSVLKSLWPFMRRMTSWADYCDWVGCGIAGGRALYITALGSEATIAADEEADRSKDVPSDHLPESRQAIKASNEDNPGRPLRYLIVTKGEPLREQLGRYVERINSIGTMRLFALRNMSSIRNASVHIEVLGRLLDGALQDWETRRSEIDRKYRIEMDAAKRDLLGSKYDQKNYEETEEDAEKLLKSAKIQKIDAHHIRQLTLMIQGAERRLIHIGGQLDAIGEGGSGRMLYVINRANYFAQEFERMYPTLAIQDVDGWINYKNFVHRGMRPALEFIAATGDRLRSIRARLQTVTETIQTAALIVETEATRENTAALKRIARNWWLRLGGGGIVIIALKQVFEPAWNWILNNIIWPLLSPHVWPWLVAHFPVH